MRDSLRKSCDIWKRWTFAPRKARRAAFAMREMLDKHALGNKPTDDVSSANTNGVSRDVGSSDQTRSETAQSDAWLDNSVQAMEFGNGLNMEMPDPSLLDGIFDTTFDDQGMDWNMWDTVMNTGEVQDPNMIAFEPQDLQSFVLPNIE